VIKHIYVTDDVLRGTAYFSPLQRPNAVWLYDLVQPIFYKMTKLKPSIWFHNFWNKMHLPSTLENWASCYFGDPTPWLVRDVGRQLHGSLVISFESSYLLQAAFDANNIPWIDLSIGPLRFLEDLTVAFKFSHHFNIAGLEPLFITNLDILHGADKVRAFYADSTVSCSKALVFFAQTETDLTLITEGGFYPINTLPPKIKELAAGRRIYVKEHPFAKHNSVIGLLVSQCGADIIDDNTYALLAKCTDCVFATISSSVGHEAQAFGHNSIAFNERMVNWLGNRRASMYAHRDPRFWSTLLSQVSDVKPVDSVVGVERNHLRKQVNYYALDKAIWP
jgi:hypothetical protein